MFTKKFLKDLAERSLRTFGQGAASYLTLMGLDLIKADVKSALIGGAAAGGYAVLTSLLAYFKKPEQESASLLDQPVVTEPGHHDGSQAPYDPATEGYLDGPTNVGPRGYERPSQPGPSQPMGFVATPLTGSPFQGPRQRDPKTGRFLPRNQGDY